MNKPVIESLWWLATGCTMVHFLWAGAVIGLFAWGGRRLLRRAPLSINYAFTLCCLLALAAAPALILLHVIDRMQTPQALSTGEWAAEYGRDEDLDAIVELSLAAWEPVFRSFEQVLGRNIYKLI